jgi:hypothetical protein
MSGTAFRARQIPGVLLKADAIGAIQTHPFWKC